jgi:MFS family permease
MALSLRGTVTAVIGLIFVRGSLQTWHVYVAAALLGIGDAFAMPASGALVPEIVRREDLPGANALNVIATQGGTIIGPVVGAILTSLGGFDASFAVVGALLFTSALCISRVPAVAPSAPSGDEHRAPQGSLKEAAVFMLSEPWLWITSLVFAACVGLSFSATLITLPILIKTSLHVQMGYYNLCIAMFPVGALIASQWLAHHIRTLRRGRLAYAMAAVIGLCHVTAALPVTVYGIGAAWLVRGIAMTLLSLTWVGTMQQLVPREMLGRVVSIDGFAQVTCVLASFLGYGWLAQHGRPEPVFLFSGTFLIMAALVGLLHRRIRTFE